MKRYRVTLGRVIRRDTGKSVRLHVVYSWSAVGWVKGDVVTLDGDRWSVTDCEVVG